MEAAGARCLGCFCRIPVVYQLQKNNGNDIHGGKITPESPYFRPAINSLTLRGDKSTGWSLAWRVSLWARPFDGNHALRIMCNALKHSTSSDIKEDKGCVYYNLLDSRPPCCAFHPFRKNA